MIAPETKWNSLITSIEPEIKLDHIWIAKRDSDTGSFYYWSVCREMNRIRLFMAK